MRIESRPPKRPFSLRIAARQLLAPLRMQPDFIIVGAQKAGTSSLFTYLVQHPAIAAPLRKEIHYFDLNAERPYSWYKAHFPLHKALDRITGEASPYYLFHPLVPDRIVKRLPNAKIIIMLRNPIDRAVSHYWHSRRHGYETLAPHDAFASEEARLGTAFEVVKSGGYSSSHQHHSYAARSCYSRQVSIYIDKFPTANLKVIAMEDLVCDPGQVVADTITFLGLPPGEITDLAPRNVNPNPKTVDMPEHVLAKLKTDAAKLDTLTGRSFSKKWFGEKGP